jgi:hypothetical protein
VTPQEYDLLMDGVADGVKEYVAPVLAQIHALHTRLSDVESRPAPKDGRDGLDGKDAEPIPMATITAAIKSQVEAFLAANPPERGERGEKGDTGDAGTTGPVGPMGPQGEKGMDAPGWMVGTGAPAERGVAGALYLDVKTGDIYQWR